MSTILCIGLNVGASEPADQLTRTLAALAQYGRVHDLAIGAGVWGGCGERMVQVSLSSHWTANRVAASLAAGLSQECVCILNPDGASWRLVYADGTVKPGGTVAEFPLHYLKGKNP